MSTMTLDESPARFQFSKALNSYSKRHHLRIFDQSEQWNGQRHWRRLLHAGCSRSRGPSATTG